MKVYIKVIYFIKLYKFYFLKMSNTNQSTIQSSADQLNLVDNKKPPFIKSPIFIGICIVIGLIIIVILYVVFTQQKSDLSNNKSKNKLSNEVLPKLNIKLATDDSEINNLINNINSEL